MEEQWQSPLALIQLYPQLSNENQSLNPITGKMEQQEQGGEAMQMKGWS